MTQPVQEPSQGRTDQGQEFRTRQLFRRPSSQSPCSAWIEPTLINSWANAGTPYCDIAYRLCGDTLEFMGHITGGSSGTVAFELDAAYWPSCDLSTLSDVITSTAPGVVQIYVAAADGSVTLTQII